MIEDGTKFLGVDASVPTPENRSSQSNGLSSMVTIEEIAEKVGAINGGGSEYTETIVNISSEQILAMGDTPIELLPILPENQWYEGFFELQFTHGVADGSYNSDNLYLSFGGYAYNPPFIKADFLNNGDNYVAKFPIEYFSSAIPLNLDFVPWDVPYSRLLGSGYGLSAMSVTNGNVGAFDLTGPYDGTLRVKIYHKTITFGA